MWQKAAAPLCYTRDEWDAGVSGTIGRSQDSGILEKSREIRDEATNT